MGTETSFSGFNPGLPAGWTITYCCYALLLLLLSFNSVCKKEFVCAEEVQIV